MHTTPNHVMGKTTSQDNRSFFDSIRSFVEESSELILLPFFSERSRVVRQLRSLLTPLDEAVAEIKRRRQDVTLLAKVEEYLGGDIPLHFAGEDPVLYLSRHLASPNHETLRFVELSKPHQLPIIIGQDTEDIFVSNNVLKRNLGKMPIVKGVTRNGDEIIENFTIIDFANNQGKKIKEIETKFGTPLAEFHQYLFKKVYPDTVQLVDESDWVSRNYRGNLYEHYTKLLALLIVHGVMFEYYEAEDDTFVNEVLLPSFKEVEKHFGLKPLIVNLVDSDLELKTDWNAYPSVVYQYVKRTLEQET